MLIQKITNYDLLNLPAKIGQIYYVTDMRCLFQDTGKLRQNRKRLSALVLNTDYERLNRIAEEKRELKLVFFSQISKEKGVD